MPAASISAAGGADAFPTTVVLLESLMKAKGIAIPEPAAE
jgi:hypothetical protein